MKKQTIISPSILAADMGKLHEEIKAVLEAGADWIHFDMMDGHFVPNLTFGPPLLQWLRKHTEATFDTHLMVQNPDSLLEDTAKAGANIITVHQEACIHLQRTVSRIRQLGCKAGVSLNPATPVSTIQHVIEDVDLILIMSVNPGFGGQKFIPESINKIKQARALIGNRPINLQVDGGVNQQNAKNLISAGADVLVAGSFIFQGSAHQYADNIKKLLS